jgi:hypothetical protein
MGEKPKAGMRVQVKYEHEGLECVVKGVINAMYSSPGDLFIRVARGGPVTMSERSF